MAKYNIESDGHAIEIKKTVFGRDESVKYDGKGEIKTFSDSSFTDYIFEKEENGEIVRYKVFISDYIWPISWRIKVQKNGRVIFTNH
ncbi:MAG: hypothetical protein JZU50_12235 [Desulfobulbaceae bacterium]|jgi:hypothetical protein|nr:hypothetical protein [Desulfobulbaceae bacterium]